MKQIWQTRGQQRDSIIVNDLNEQISDWVAGINGIEVPRWYQTTKKAVKIKLHVFWDASKDEFCAVVYIVSEFSDFKGVVSFVFGKQ